MAITTPSTLETANYGTQGWNAIMSANVQKINDYVWKQIAWQNPIVDRDLATPPGSPAQNSRYIVAGSPTGAWSGHAGKIAHYSGSAWDITTPTEGYIVYLLDENIFAVYNGSAWVNLSTFVDHGSALGLADDDHTQYALLAGRSSGQAIKGGTASGENLTLMSTNHATKGKLLIGTSAYDEANNRLGVNKNNPEVALDVNGTAQIPTVRGGSGSGNDLTLTSSSNATKGKIIVGNSAYDEVNNRFGIGTATPDEKLHVAGGAKITGNIDHDGSQVGFYGVTPVNRPSAYTITNATPTRTLDASTATLADLINLVAQLQDDLKNQGLSQ